MNRAVPRRRVFSGIQPSSNDLHLGNYLGAVKHWVARQDERESFICIVDLHAITVRQEPEDLRASTLTVGASLIACGIDPGRTTLFVQSHVPAHAEAAWILGCTTPLGWLERMTQFKAKSERQAGRERIGVGLFTYPVLQAADILLYDADEVPVGEDQKQHVELARDIAGRFNHRSGEDFFVLPEAVIPTAGARVMALDDPTAKMSKSESAGRGHSIKLTDEDDEIRRSFKRAVTDSGREIAFSADPERAGVNNLLGIYRAVTDKSREQVLADFADARGYGDLKTKVAEAVIDVVAPIRERFEELMPPRRAWDDPDTELNSLLARGAERARAVSGPKLEKMRKLVGFA